MDRVEGVKREIETLYKSLKLERQRNLKLINADNPILLSKIPSIRTVLARIENECVDDWGKMKEIIAIVREMRFLGSPKRTEISTALLNGLVKIYSIEKDDQKLVECLSNLLSFDEMNPLVIEDLELEDGDGNGEVSISISTSSADDKDITSISTSISTSSTSIIYDNVPIIKSNTATSSDTATSENATSNTDVVINSSKSAYKTVVYTLKDMAKRTINSIY